MPTDLVETKGIATANCYCSQDEATDYLDSLYGADEWAQLDSDTMDRLILTAAKQIDAFNVGYAKLASDQSMKFPVDTAASFGDGYDQAKEANILQAFYLFQNNDAMVESRTGALQGKTSESIGPMSMSTVGFNSIRSMHGSALRLLAPYLNLAPKLMGGRLAR